MNAVPPPATSPSMPSAGNGQATSEAQRLSAAIEAILFSSHRPLRLRELQQATETDRAEVEAALEALRESLAHRGVMLQRHRDEVHLATRPEVATYVRRALRPEVAGRLSPAAYETLAIVAYQQPVTRSRIEEIRGVNSDGVLANLELRDLVVEVGRGSGPGQPKLYGTTMRFLQVLGLESLDELRPPEEDGRLPTAQLEDGSAESGAEAGEQPQGGSPPSDQGGAEGTASPGRRPQGGSPPSGQEGEQPSPSD